MEAYKIWATLNLRGDAQTKMMAFINTTKKANAEMLKLTRLLKLSEGLAGLDKANRRVNVLERSLSNVTRQAERATHAMTRMGNGNASSGSIAMGSGRRRSHLGGLHHVGLIGLGEIAPGAAGIAGAAYAGGPLAAGAFAGGMLVHQGFQQERKYQKAVGIMQAQGITGAQLGQANALANQVRPGISQASMMEAIADSLMASRDFKQALSLAPTLAQGALMANVFYGGMTHHQQQDLVRVAEIAGGSDPKKIAEWLNVALNMMHTSAGTVGPQEQRTFWRQSGGALSRLTPMGYLSLEPVIQELGGSRTGTALTTGIRSFSNPKITHFAKHNVERLKELGFWDPKTNRMKAEYLEMLQTDPSMFAHAWVKGLAAHGVTSDQAMLTETMSSLPRTFGQLLALMVKNMEKIDKSRAIAEGLKSPEAMKDLAGKHIEFSVIRLGAAWESLTDAIGKITTPATIDGLNWISSALENLAKTFTLFNQGEIKQGFIELGKTLVKASPVGFVVSTGMDYLNKNSNGKSQTIETKVYIGQDKLIDIVSKGIVKKANTQVDAGTMSVNLPFNAISVGQPNPFGGTL